MPTGREMGHDSQPIRMAANGRLSIPAKQRKALGLEKGGLVVATVENGELRIRTVKAVLDELRERLAPYLKASGDTVDRFIADRHAEAEREEAEYQEWKANRR
jgi:antitoxin PrlF